MSNLTAQQLRQVRGLITMGVITIFAFYAFYFNSDKTESITFGFIVGNEWVLLKEWVVASKTGAGIFLICSMFGLLIGYLEFKAKRTLTFSSLIFGFGFVMSFLCCYRAHLCFPYR